METRITVMNSPVRLLNVLSACAVAAATAQAQDMRVYTTVSRLSESGEPQVLSRSLTLFHAGKVFDHMVGLGEVVIFEPAADRFIILSADDTATTVQFDEIRHYLKIARQKSSKYIEQLAARNDPQALQHQRSLQAQLTPQLSERFEPATGRIDLTCEEFSYSVTTVAPPSPEVAEAYLDYADWAARLNFVLRSGAIYPQARIELNERLKERGVLPLSVELVQQTHPDDRLQAEHRFGWSLQDWDRRQIDKWQRLVESDRLKWVSLQEYQQQFVVRSNR